MSLNRLTLTPLVAGLIASVPPSAAAQRRADTLTPPPSIKSMGQPLRWQPYGSAVGAFGRNDDATGGVALGLFHPIGSPVNGVFGLSGEGYLFAAHGSATGGARLLGVTPAINLGYGIDWDARANNFAFMLSYNTAVRRGGLLGGGTRLRVDWIPARSSGVDVGITIPLFQPYAGRTRPRRTGVALKEVAHTPAPSRTAPTMNVGDTYSRASVMELPPDADSALRAAQQAALLISAYTNFFDEHHESSQSKDIARTREIARRVRDSIAVVSADYPQGRTYAAAERVYKASLDRAFAIAAGDAARGDTIARRARAGLLTQFLIPYNALFGRQKDRQYNLSALTDAMRADFLAWLNDSSGVQPGNHARVLRVHNEWMGVVRAVHDRLSRQWSDSRTVWMPFQLALTPEEHDDQAEIDALMARVIGRPFTRGNEITYLQEDRVQIEIARSIHAARDYHVLWIHDFAGERPSGRADIVGFGQTANSYFPALTRAVQRYDSTGILTTYLIFLDQNFYEPTNGRLWMTILEDPLGARIELPKGSDSLVRILRTRQQELRAAVAGSKRLQALAAQNGGEDWLKRTVKVHVNITQPSDFTFRSHRIIEGVPLLPDNLMRDHRKIAFYDVTEADPYRGAMILSGVGIGEHYATPTWEDRGMRMTGPAVLEVRAAARRLLRLNNFKDSQIPPPLRATGDCTNCVTASLGRLASDNPAFADLGSALQVHNEPGFGAKYASVARAMLYTLSPKGSVIVAPDGLWLGGSWAGMLAGAALRGSRVYIVAPAIANAPSAGFPQMARTQDVILRLLQVRQEFLKEIHAAGGELRIGLYNAKDDVNDIAKQGRAIRAGIDKYPWLHDLVPLAPSVLAVFDSAPDVLERAGYRPYVLARDQAPRLPQLHRKTQFFADSAALARLASRPEWREVVIQALIEGAKRAQRGLRTGLYDDTTTDAGIAAAKKLLQSYYADRPAADSARMTFYLTIGTQNQDPRGMMLDGEAVFVVGGMSAAVGLIDLYGLLARSTWIDTEKELNELLPPYDSWQHRLGRFARFVL